MNAHHITTDVNPRGFVKTIPSDDKKKEKVFALDCEMVGVGPEGLDSALARLSIINWDNDAIGKRDGLVCWLAYHRFLKQQQHSV